MKTQWSLRKLIPTFILIIGTYIIKAHAQNCATGWIAHNNKCWYFSDNAINHAVGMTWTEAESHCQQNNAHLASFESAEERDWIYNNYLTNWDDTKWWIGLNDVKGSNSFVWSDETYFDPAVANWKPGEPSNSGKEDCVEIWIDKPLYPGLWNDNNCDKVYPFICKGDTGKFESSCPVGWTKKGDVCYKIQNTEKNWHDADVDCRLQGAVLVSITSSDEQSNVQTLISPQNQNFWLGLSDQASPGTLTWSNTEAQSSAYTNWGSGQPPSPLTYLGSTCTEMSQSLNYKWSTVKCGVERKYVCQRGLVAQCPPGWTYLAGKCYEFIVNSNRLATWTSADQFCKAQGAQLLKIETDQQELYIGSILQQYQKLGFREMWLGGSDLAKDDTFAWSDGSPIQKAYWNLNMPSPEAGRQDCMSIYTGKTADNWETSSCFYSRPFICELPEGTSIVNDGSITVSGKCEEGWRHVLGSCYYFGTQVKTQSDASQYCMSMTSELTSITDSNEQSFIIGHITSPSWIGLQYQSGSYRWLDGETLDFNNWNANKPTNQPCVYMAAGGEWFDDVCSGVRAFVCKKAETPTPDQTLTTPSGNPGDVEKCGGGGWFSDPSSTQCYLINEVQVRTWNDARFACQSQGGDLIAINTPDENAFIHLATGNLPTVTELWIGAFDNNNYALDIADGGWKWSDNSPFRYVNWNSGEPNNANSGEDCAELYAPNGLWNDNDCLVYRHFICEKRGNVENVPGPDVSDDNCGSSESCCFKHIGVEIGGSLDDSALTASTEADKFFAASRGRLNTPADVIILNDNIYVGSGHGAWEPRGDDAEPWLQVDFNRAMELKGIITQGRNGLIQYSERQWTTTYKISYSQDPTNTGKAVGEWEWLSGQDGNAVIFDGNSDQNTQVTNMFPRPIIARHVRCHPVTWKDRGALRIEYIGCRASCMHKLGMNSGLIGDSRITASSSAGSKTAQQARAPVDKDECLPTASDPGVSYRGWIAKTVNGRTCQRWSDQYPHSHDNTPEKRPDSGLVSNHCRNPDGEPGPWCYTTDPDVRWELCYIPVCPTYTPSGWSPSSSNTNQYVQVQFSEYFKVSGVTLYGSTSTYVSRYALYFSDDGTNFKVYSTQTGGDNLFYGLNGKETQFTDVLREPVSTQYVRVQPRQWTGSIIMQFEINGCYVTNRLSCSDMGTDIAETTFDIDCPSGCIEDVSSGLVYGTTTYTENSAMCPAAIHAGRITNQQGGSVTVVKTSGQATYTGSYANGIQSLDASASHLSLTFDGSVYRCDTGWEPWKDHCYYLSPKNYFKNWHDARADCIAMGADLTSIQSSAENDFHEFIITHGDRGKDVWIGMNDLRTQNFFEWSDDVTVTYTKWGGNEPNGGNERCVQIYRLFGTWNDKKCEGEISYICKKEKQRLPPLPVDETPVDEGCEVGWKAFGSSCYQTSPDEYMFIYANRICNEKDAKLVSIHDQQEQAFVHALVANNIPSGLGYTSWIGLAAFTAEQGDLYYKWEGGESVTYTNWDYNEPDVRFSCAFPFEYKGVSYDQCITFDHPARLQDTPWCSIDPIYSGGWINCDTGYEYGCTYMNDQTGFWQIDICGQNRYYVCEKDRVGYTQGVYTTPSTEGPCPSGWDGDSTTSACYQINEYSDNEVASRLSWSDAVDYCQAQGADLVSIHSSNEAEAVSKFVTSKGIYSYTYFWMGLHNIDLSSGYAWTDGSPVDYTNWAAGEPNNNQGLENCVEAQFYDAYGGWNDLTCDSRRNYICKIKKGITPLPPPTLPPPDGNENDPACGSDPDGTWVRYQPSYGADKCYMFITDPFYGWQFAENTCIEKGGNLVAIHSSDENSFLVGRMGLTSQSIFWVGMRDVGGRAFYWSDGSTLDYVNWASGEPNNYYDSEGCVTMHVDGGTWNDDNCGRLFSYVCEKMVGAPPGTVPPTAQATGNCPAGFTPYGNTCFITGGSNKLTWEDSRQWCKDNSAELAVITNQYEQAFLNSFLDGSGQTFWLGLSDRFTNNGQFVWIDGTEVSYTNWAPGEPSGYAEGCAVINSVKDGFWEDNDCLAVNSFICYTAKSDDIAAPEPTKSPIGCKDGYYASSSENECFKVVDKALSWSDAQQSCRSEGDRIDLASINEIYDNDLIKSYFWHDVTAGKSMWIGMSFTADNSGGSSTAKFSWSDGWPTLYTNWGPGEPNSESISAGSGCVMMENDGAWTSVPQTGSGSNCGTALPYVCKQSFGDVPTTVETPTGSCDPGFVAVGGYCYYIQTGDVESAKRSWYEAAYMCEERGATLASIHSQEEADGLLARFTDVTTNNLFIGLSSNGFNGWAWKDGSSAEYFNWAPNEPNGQAAEECVEMYSSDGTWNDINCFESKGYICKAPRGTTQCNVETYNRIECGFQGIDEAYCVSSRGCCYDEQYVSANISGCFYPEGAIVGPSGVPIDPTDEPVVAPEGLSGGAIAGIIVAVLVVLVLVAGIVYFCACSDAKSLPSVSMPSMPASWSSSSKSSEKSSAPGGFDNPVALGDDGNFHTVA